MAINQYYTVFTPEVWSPVLNKSFRENLVAAKAFADFSDDIAGGGDVIHIPHLEHSFTISDIKQTSGEVSAESINDTQTQLTLNKWQGSAFRISDWQAKIVSKKYNIKRQYADQLGFDLAKKFDTQLMAEYTNFTNVIGGSTTDLSDTALEQGMSIMESNSVPREKLRLIVHPRNYYGDLFKRDKYYDSSVFGKTTLPNGAIDQVYGVPVFRTPQVPLANGSLKNLLVHPMAVSYALATQDGGAPSGARISEKEGESLRKTVVGDIMYGIKALKTGAAVVIAATNDR